MALIHASAHSRRIPIFGAIGLSNDEVDGFAVARQIDAAGRNEPLTLLIDSPGGAVAAARAICRAIERRSAPTVTWAVETCESAAAVIFACGSRRIAEPFSSFMVHSAARSATAMRRDRETADVLRELVDQLDADDDWIAGVLHRATGQPKAVVRRLMAKEEVMGPERAKSIGLATEITKGSTKPPAARTVARPLGLGPAYGHGMVIGMAPRHFHAYVARAVAEGRLHPSVAAGFVGSGMRMPCR